MTESINIEQVVASAKGQLGILETSKFDTLLEVWINEAVRQTHSGDLLTIKGKLLDLINGEADLPKGYRSPIGLRFTKGISTTFDISTLNVSTTFRGASIPSNSLGVNNDTYVRTVSPFDFYVKTNGAWVLTPLVGGKTESVCNRILFYDPETASNCGCDTKDSRFGQYAFIRDGKIKVANIPDDSTEVEFFYKGISMSEDCLYLIRPEFERACCAYARMRFYEAFPEIKGERISINSGVRAQNEWVNQAGYLRGIAARNEWDRNKYEISMLLRCWFSKENNY